jgi:hypothetical protein
MGNSICNCPCESDKSANIDIHINNSYNNINNLQNLSNYNQNLTNQINQMNNLNNLGNLKNLQMGNFQMPLYDQQKNQLINAVITSNMKQSFSLPINNEDMNNHKKLKKIQSPNEQNYSMNPSLNLGVLPNLNYNGPNINNTNNSINNKKISLSSQPPKNTIPNFNQGENLNLVFNQNKMNQQGISMFNMNVNPLGNKSFYMPQNLKNVRMNNNNNIWNNLNNNGNTNNNNHLNGNSNNNNINNNVNINDNFVGNKNNNNNVYNKKDFNNNNRINHNNNNNLNNNKKYQKLYNNFNTFQPSNMNMNNNHNNTKNNKLSQHNDNNNLNNTNNVLRNKNNNNNNINTKTNYNLNNYQIRSNNETSKPYLLSLSVKLDDGIEIINIKSLKDINIVLEEIKEKKNLNEKMVKLIQKKINNAVEIIQKIFDYNLDKYTYKNLSNINYQISHKRKKNEEIKNKRNNSSKQLHKYYDEKMVLSVDDIKQAESLNISY